MMPPTDAMHGGSNRSSPRAADPASVVDDARQAAGGGRWRAPRRTARRRYLLQGVVPGAFFAVSLFGVITTAGAAAVDAQ
jgi:hypothetical protein